MQAYDRNKDIFMFANPRNVFICTLLNTVTLLNTHNTVLLFYYYQNANSFLWV